MNNPLDNRGVLTVVLWRFEKQILPRIFDIKDMVENGRTLSDSNIEFLNEALIESRNYESFVVDHADFNVLFARTAHLYHEITTKALENEQQNGSGVLPSSSSAQPGSSWTANG
ncbi:MAG: hypothetical protein ABW076_04980 [Candidatus Thiodiazotropha sp.]